MSRFLNELEKACKSSYDQKVATGFWRYVTTGDEAALAGAKSLAQRYSLYWLGDVWRFLAEPDQLSDEEERAMHAVVVLKGGEELAGWLGERVEGNQGAEEAYLKVFQKAFGGKKTDQVKAATALVEAGPEPALGDRPTPIEAFLLSLTDGQLQEVVSKCDRHNRLLELLLVHSAERVAPLVEACIYRTSRHGKYVSAESCELLLKYGGDKYEETIATAFRGDAGAMSRFLVGVELSRFQPNLYRNETRTLARTILEDENWAGNGEQVCGWLVEQFGKDALGEVGDYLARHANSHCTEPTLRNLVESLGRDAHGAVVAALRNPSPALRLTAIGQLMDWADEADRDLLRQAFEKGLAEQDSQDVIRFLVAATGWDLACLEEPIWKLLAHKSRPVRETAARTLGRLGDRVVPRAGELLGAKKAAARSSAVTLLRTAGTDMAVKLLEGRLDEETDEEVRDQILLALESVWQLQGKKISREEIEGRIERTLGKFDGRIAPWLEESRLPPLNYAKGGKPLSGDAVRYLLYRQSRAKEMRADVEAKPLLALIDRTRSGDFALATLQMFLSGSMEARDRWALAIVGMLGDDRAVAPLMQQIRTWVDGGRGKMAEYAAQALALVGSDVALCAVDSLSIRYRSKQKNIGKAASESFAEAAERLGVTVEELGDRVVPWLGFEPGKPRVIEHGEKRVEMGIGMDFKLSYRDLVKEKKISSLPAAFPADVKAELKELGATLREVVKGQLIRLENLMVRQFRWPRERWCELYLAHPLLRPFGVRLVWGVYGGDGRLQAAFRALEDGTLTNEDDEQVELPQKGNVLVGIVHPLELSAEQRQAWATHLADYNIQSPFLQLERPVVFPAEDEKQTRMSTKYRGTSLNAMTFKGRAERLGWQRGSVCDGGGITCYAKSFPGAGADAILGLDGMYIGIDMYADIKLEQFCFVRGGSVTFGSYTYDEPSNDKDPRLIPFGEVPPIVYSEILGDLGKIAGQQEGEEES